MEEVIKMTAEERKEFEEFKREKQRNAAEAKAKKDRKAYKELASEAVDEVFVTLEECSERLTMLKNGIYARFNSLLLMKKELFQLGDNQRSHTFRNASGTRRITLGYYVNDAWDDTVDAGIEKVKEYIESLATSDETGRLVRIILDLLAKDKQGNLKAAKVLQLDKYARESNSVLFREGVQIIIESYHPARTKQFVRAEKKNELGAWVNVPLGMTEA